MDVYNQQVEESRLQLIDKQLTPASPLLAVACLDGVCFATASARVGFRKVRLVHPKGIAFAGIGESNVIELIARGVTFRAHEIELASGLRAVTASEILSEESYNGALQVMRSIFADRRMRPFIGEFLLAELRESRERPALFYVARTGISTEIPESFLVLGANEKARPISEQLDGMRFETLERTGDALRALWQQQMPEVRPQLLLLSRDHPSELRTA